jgi:hypothetical protein
MAPISKKLDFRSFQKARMIIRESIAFSPQSGFHPLPFRRLTVPAFSSTVRRGAYFRLYPVCRINSPNILAFSFLTA